MSPDNQVKDAIAIDVPGARHRNAEVVESAKAVNPEAVRGSERREIQRRCETIRLPEHHITLPRVRGCTWMGMEGSDDHVVKAIAIHVSGVRHRMAGVVARQNAIDLESIRAIESAQVHRIWSRENQTRFETFNARSDDQRRHSEMARSGQRPLLEARTMWLNATICWFAKRLQPVKEFHIEHDPIRGRGFGLIQSVVFRSHARQSVGRCSCHHHF